MNQFPAKLNHAKKTGSRLYDLAEKALAAASLDYRSSVATSFSESILLCHLSMPYSACVMVGAAESRLVSLCVTRVSFDLLFDLGSVSC